MRSVAHLLLLVAALGVARPAVADATGQQRAQDAGRELVGTAAPRLAVTTIDGERIDLGSLYGRKAVYLKFWATWCTPCREQMPHFENVYESAGPDLAVIAINTGFNDSLDEVRRYRARLGIRMPIVIDDGTLAAAFNLRVTPQHVVIGRDGHIRYVGHLADGQLDAALLAARHAATSAADARPARAVAAGLPARVGAGDLLPDDTITTLDGHPFPLRPGPAGRRTVLVFLSPWCESYLADSRPALAAACRDTRQRVDALAGDARARWLGIASGLWADREDLRQYVERYHVGIPVALDESGALFRAFRVQTVPAIYVADADGRLSPPLDINDPQGLARALDMR